MIPNPYAILGGAIGGLLLLIGVYFYGRSDGQGIERAAQDRAAAAVAKVREQREVAVDQGNGAGELAETKRATQTREVTHEVFQIVDRPVYRSQCVDADGVRILDRAAANADGTDPGQPAGQAGPGPESATPARR